MSSSEQRPGSSIPPCSNCGWGEGFWSFPGKCACGERLVVQTSDSHENPFRRFVGCPGKGNGAVSRVPGCPYFEWVDPKFHYQANQAIRELQDEKSIYVNECMSMGRKLKQKTEELEKLQIEHDEMKGEYEFAFEDTKKEMMQIQLGRTEIEVHMREIQAEKTRIRQRQKLNIGAAVVLVGSALLLHFVLKR